EAEHMSAVTCLLSEDHFLCPICLDVFTAPVTIPCGHTFCKNCITQNWRINRKCKCPVCKKLFDIITELHVNIFISEMAAQFRQSTAKQTSEVSKPGEVPCDVCTEVTEHIKQKQKAAEEQAEDFIKELDHEISKLRKRKSEVKQLVHSDDHLHLLQSFSSLSTFPPTKDWSKASLRQPSYEGVAARAVAQLKDTLSKGMEKLLEAELKRVQRYAVDLTLDPDTAHPKLILSDDGKQVNHSDVEKNLPDNPERFSYCVIVLSKQSFSCGRFYYEVEVKGKTKWDLGVASVSANRKGQITSSPEAGYWTLQLRNGKEYVALTDPDVVLSVKQRPQKVGVFVDYEEGLVCFFDVDTADLIYSFTGCSFTDKLHPFFSPCFNDNGDNSAPLRISAVNQTDCISHL
uniref:Bloodthirsty-related gene family, member 1 n=1 Tax=Anabas testudineus TaxID=64144 RepID=A0A3Q1HPF3_ANATE